MTPTDPFDFVRDKPLVWLSAHLLRARFFHARHAVVAADPTNRSSGVDVPLLFSRQRVAVLDQDRASCYTPADLRTLERCGYRIAWIDFHAGTLEEVLERIKAAVGPATAGG